MYLWVVLITFIAMLYSYNLSVRGDERQLSIEPMAEAEVSRFAVHHRMGQQYVKERSPKHETNPLGVEGGEIQYSAGILDYEDDLKDYQPVGFVPNDNYQTEIYCAVEEDWSTENADCTADFVAIGILFINRIQI